MNVPDKNLKAMRELVNRGRDYAKWTYNPDLLMALADALEKLLNERERREHQETAHRHFEQTATELRQTAERYEQAAIELINAAARMPKTSKTRQGDQEP